MKEVVMPVRSSAHVETCEGSAMTSGFAALRDDSVDTPLLEQSRFGDRRRQR
jgi:hypothetical protein